MSKVDGNFFMRRTFIVLLGLFGLAVLFFQLASRTSSSVPEAQPLSSTNHKKLLKPAAIRPRTVGERSWETNAIAAGDEEEPPFMKLSGEQLAAYLSKYSRNAESLITAFEECRDPALLKEAAERFPNDPRVQMAVLMWDSVDKNLSVEERTLWLDRFKKEAPDNMLANTLSALDKFNNGRKDLAVAELQKGNNKARLSGYNSERIQSLEEMYLTAGLSPVEAKEQATHSILLPLEAKMKSIAVQLAEMQKNYLAAGDAASAAQVAALGATLGRRWTDPNSSPLLISEMVGLSMQRISLQNLDTNTSYDFLGKTAGERLAELKAEREETRHIATDEVTYYPKLSEHDKMVYLDRLKMFGERNAWRWLLQTQGKGRTSD
jgi:hypothetical protein